MSAAATATPDAAVANGNGAPNVEADLELPVDSYKDAAKLLRRPFTVNAVKFKVQATWAGENAGAMIVAYIDARLAVERLNLVCPHLWRDAPLTADDPAGYKPISENRMWCCLVVDGIARADVGEGVGKGLVSDALKRAAVKFGVGVSLYAIPQIRLFVKDGLLRDTGKQDKKGKPLYELTPNGLTRCRDIYEQWLESRGIQAFGVPLDHGDVEEAVGDAEAPTETPTPAVETAAPPAEPEAPKPVTKKRAEELFELAKECGLDGQRVSMWLTNKGVEHDEVTNKATAVDALRKLNEASATFFVKAAEAFRDEQVAAIDKAAAEQEAKS